MKLKALIVFFLMGSMSLTAQKSYQLQSPDKKLQAVVTVGDDIRFSFTHDGTEVLAASPISMTLQNGVVLGAGPKVWRPYGLHPSCGGAAQGAGRISRMKDEVMEVLASGSTLSG